MIVDLMEMLAKTINEHEKIRPYLREYPFPSTRSKIWVYFMKDKFDHYHDGSVTQVCVDLHNTTVFFHYDKNDPSKECEVEEPYSLSEKIVHNNT